MAAVADGAQQPVLIVDGEFGPYGEERREAGGLGEIPPVIIDAIFKPGIALRVGAGLAFEHDGAAVGQNEPVPDEQDTALPELHVVVVLADDTCALRHEQNAPRGAVVDMFRDLRGDLAGKSERMPVMSAADMTAPA
ncbi:hypothetical protein MesoLjLb_47570 [Mesorhizobium sp. L-8-3]|nr:hypothetical protein MesoLjLb_47570 [Mesorhizobium sp. L-8-3]